MRPRVRSWINLLFSAALLATGLVGVAAIAQVPEEVWTGCLSSEDGKVYDVQLGDQPANPCKKKDTIIRLGSGDITAVLAGDGLVGGGYSGEVELGLDWEALDEAYGGEIPWGRLVDVPPDLADGDQTGSPLAGVECNPGRYVVGFDPDGNAMCSDGQIAEPPPEPWVGVPTASTGHTNASFIASFQAPRDDALTGRVRPTQLLVFEGASCDGEPTATIGFSHGFPYHYAYYYLQWADDPAGTLISWQGQATVEGQVLRSDCDGPITVPEPLVQELLGPSVRFAGRDLIFTWPEKYATWSTPDGRALLRVDHVDVFVGSACTGDPAATATYDLGDRDWSWQAAWTEQPPGTPVHARAVSGALAGPCSDAGLWLEAPDPPPVAPTITRVASAYVYGEGGTGGSIEIFDGPSCEGSAFLMETTTFGDPWVKRFSPYYYSVPPVGPGDTISTWSRIAVSTTECTVFEIPLA